jgi:hypothetical protein
MTRAEVRSLRPWDRHPRLLRWVDDAIAAVFVIGSAFVPFPETQFRPTDALTVALVIAPAAILPLRRRWPVPVLAACVALYGLAAFTAMLWPGIAIAIAIAMLGVGNRSPQRTTLITAMVTISAVILINVLAALASVLDPRVFAVARSRRDHRAGGARRGNARVGGPQARIRGTASHRARPARCSGSSDRCDQPECRSGVIRDRDETGGRFGGGPYDPRRSAHSAG